MSAARGCIAGENRRALMLPEEAHQGLSARAAAAVLTTPVTEMTTASRLPFPGEAIGSTSGSSRG